MVYTRRVHWWITVWFLLILKIPIAYLCLVLWWAIKDPPQPGEEHPVAVREPLDGSDPALGRRRRRFLPRPRHAGPHGSPRRRHARVALTRARDRMRA